MRGPGSASHPRSSPALAAVEDLQLTSTRRTTDDEGTDDVASALRSILPDEVALATSGLADEPEPLFAEEFDVVRNAVEGRRREFGVGRQCARRALADLGVAASAITSGPHREPSWPPGVVGAITHTGDFCAAAVALRSEFAGLGIDVESAVPLDRRLVPYVCTTAECQRFGMAIDEIGKIVFSAKESIYKCVFPLMRRFIGMLEVEVDLVDKSHFAVLSAPFDWLSIRGRYWRDESYVVTTATRRAAPTL